MRVSFANATKKPIKSGLFSLSVALLLSSSILTSCASDAPPPLPPPAPAGPSVNLSSLVSDSASTYIAYVNMAKNMDNQFADAQTIQTKLQQAAAFEPRELARGVIAYGAIIAMQEPSFRSSLRAYASNQASRADLVAKIYENPSYAANLPGADEAARRVILGLSSDGNAVFKSGERIKQSAYDIQHQTWSREFIKARDERLMRTKISSTTVRSVDQSQSSNLHTIAINGSGLDNTRQNDASIHGESQFNAPYTNAVNNSLAIAALAILGEGAGQNETMIAHLLEDSAGSSCLGLTKLNLYQCLSVAKPHFEDVFCIGQHELMDTGQCIGKMSSRNIGNDHAAKVQASMDNRVTAKPYITPPVVKKSKGKKASSTAASSKTSAKPKAKASKKAKA